MSLSHAGHTHTHTHTQTDRCSECTVIRHCQSNFIWSYWSPEERDEEGVRREGKGEEHEQKGKEISEQQ